MSHALRYEPAEPTDEQRKQARQSEAYKQGDLCLIWANKADLFNADLFNIEVGIYRNQIIQELIKQAEAEAKPYKAAGRKEMFPAFAAEWLKSQMKGGE